MRAQKVMFGHVSMYRVNCSDCGGSTLVVGGVKKCCGWPVEKPTRVSLKRESGVAQVRRTIGPKKRRELLAAQGNRCVYCEVEFGSGYIDRSGRQAFIKPQFDHFQPWAYMQNNKASNFVAACVFCNQTKGALVFNSLEEARLHILERRGLIGGSTVQADPDVS